jgi:hypothetical protein
VTLSTWLCPILLKQKNPLYGKPVVLESKYGGIWRKKWLSGVKRASKII